MNPTPTTIVTRFIERCSAGDVDGALALCHEDLEYDNVPVPTIHGREAARAFLTGMLGGGVRARWDVHAQVAEGHRVMNERTDHLWYPDGRHVELPVAGLFEVHHGVITRWRDFFDLRTFEQQLASTPAVEAPARTSEDDRG